MTKNYMEDVAKLLGVELYEDFIISGLAGYYRFTTEGLEYWSSRENKWHKSCNFADLLTGFSQIIKISKPALDDKEKEYLSNVIKPFRDKVISISKKSANYGEFIDIVIDEAEDIYLPYFKPGKMYQGIGVNREYTLEELGL